LKEVNVHEAKTHLSRLLQRVAAGEEITIANRGVPVAQLIPATAPKVHRELGVESGRLIIAEDFDAPIPADILDAFLGGEKKPKSRRK